MGNDSKDKLNYDLNTADDVKAERIRLEAAVKKQEDQIKDRVGSVTNVFSNPIPGLTSLFSDNKKSKPVRAGLETTVNLLVAKVLANRLGPFSTMATPFISKTISQQLMAINAKPYAISALDWVINLTEEEPEDEYSEVEPQVWRAEVAEVPKVDSLQPIVTPKLPEVTVTEGNDGTVHIS